MSAAAAALEQVLGLLIDEERQLSRLIALALEEQTAVLESGFDRITAISAAMLEAANAIEALESRRLSLLRTIGAEDLTIEGLLPLADDLGVAGFADARLRLSVRARELKDAQERNASLLVNAMKLRDRWANMLGGLASPTYGAQGQRTARDGTGFVSRSA
ncbi:MAG: flagellar export chaperone FlgN [Dehalococcoidia bacterium]|nr:flagellar export chaperone FlgN [Dehalococcoidia bacterium]